MGSFLSTFLITRVTGTGHSQTVGRAGQNTQGCSEDSPPPALPRAPAGWWELPGEGDWKRGRGGPMTVGLIS